MNKGLLVLNIVLLVAVGVLFFLFFTRNDKTTGTPVIKRSGVDSAAAWEHTPVAYFEMDSIEAHFIEFRKMQDEVLKNEKDMYDTINGMKATLQMQLQKFQEQESKMSPQEVKDTREYLMSKDQEIKNKEKELNQEYQKYYLSMQQGIITKIKNYCKEFNKDGKYSYIIASDPGIFYYTDTAFNITTELVKGLNEYYSKGKKN